MNAEKLFVVIDPYESRHQTLERAVITAGIRDLKPNLHLYINPQKSGSSATHKPFGPASLQELTNILDMHALPYNYEFSWSADIEKSVVDSARTEEANLIIYPLTDEIFNKHKGLTHNTWTLLRSSTCPVMLVRPDSAMQRKTILAAVNFQSPFPEYAQLNTRIIKRARWLADKYDAQLYVVNAFNSMADYPHYDDIQKESGLGTEHIIVEEGKPEKVVARAAEKIGADLVLIGTRNSHDLEMPFRRNTAEKVLMELHRDMIVVN